MVWGCKHIEEKYIFLKHGKDKQHIQISGYLNIFSGPERREGEDTQEE